MISCDTNILLYASDESCIEYEKASSFMFEMVDRKDFVICELVLVELFRLLCHKKVLRFPLSCKEAAKYCMTLRSNPNWPVVEYSMGSMEKTWKLAASLENAATIFDLRLGLVLYTRGVTEFVTRNTKDFKKIGFRKLTNPID